MRNVLSRRRLYYGGNKKIAGLQDCRIAGLQEGKSVRLR
jgi:hypothetical protein